MEPKARSKGEIMMLRRQAAEDRRMTYEHVKAADRKAFSTAQWQEKTDKKVAEQNITRRFNALRTQQQEAVCVGCGGEPSYMYTQELSGSKACFTRVVQKHRKPLNSLVFSRCTQNGSQSILFPCAHGERTLSKVPASMLESLSSPAAATHRARQLPRIVPQRLLRVEEGQDGGPEHTRLFRLDRSERDVVQVSAVPHQHLQEEGERNLGEVPVGRTRRCQTKAYAHFK